MLDSNWIILFAGLVAYMVATAARQYAKKDISTLGQALIAVLCAIVLYFVVQFANEETLSLLAGVGDIIMASLAAFGFQWTISTAVNRGGGNEPEDAWRGGVDFAAEAEEHKPRWTDPW